MSLLKDYCPRIDFASYEDFFANFRLNIPENFNFAYDVVDKYAATEPARRALVWCNDFGKEKIYDFAEMSQASCQAANFFKSLGIKKGDFVILLSKGHHQFWPCVLALHRIGAIAVPGTHMLKKKDLLYRFSVTEAKMIICADERCLLDEVDAAVQSWPGVIRVALGSSRSGWYDYDLETAKFPREFPRPQGPDATHNDDPMLGYFSSGTSGEPKMVMHSYTYPLAHIITAKYWLNVIDGGLHYTVADTGWAKCAWGKLYGQWLSGSAVFVHDYETFNAKTLLERAVQYKVTTFCAPPTVYRFLIREDLSTFDLSSIKYAVTAGEALNPEVYNRFKEITGLKIREGYGQTELIITTATLPWSEPKVGSIGKPIPGMNLELLSLETGKPVEAGEEGEICLYTDGAQLPYGIFRGYYRAENMTRKCWHDGWYHTGDMAWRDEDGFLWFVGRADDVIKTSGYRVGPSEVENALMEHPSVLECAVTGVPDEIRGMVIKATIVLNRGFTPGEELKKELQEHVKHTTAPYKYPRVVEFVDALPKTISGKIRRAEIRRQQQERQRH